MNRNPKSRIRTACVFGVMMAMSVSVLFFLPTISTSGVNEETKELAEEQITAKEEAAKKKAAVPGDVYDTNMNLLVSTDPDSGARVYADDLYYSNILGYSTDSESQLLLGNLDSILREPEGGTDKGDNLKLTIDSEVQEYAYSLLSNAEEERGSIVVLDAKTGAIVAMACNPSYSISTVLSNDGVLEDGTPTYESNPLQAPTRPGSIFKLVTSTGILENHLEDLGIEDNGSYKFSDGSEIRDAEGEPTGTWDLTTGLVHSSNVYFGRMTAEHLGWTVMDNLAERFLIGEQNMSFEFGTMNSTYESSLEPYDRTKSTRQLAQVGYGYADLQLTALQAAMITQTVANKGVMCMPYMLDGIYKTAGYSIGDGQYVYEMGEKSDLTPSGWRKGETKKVMSEDVADGIRDAMVATYKNKYHLLDGLTEDGLTVNGTTYSMAIKTGTADLKTDGTDNNIWMVSFAPADDPQYIVVVNRYSVGKKFGISLLGDVVSMYRELFAEE